MKTVTLIVLILIASVCNGQSHRKHELGTTYMTYPPIYSCAHCLQERSPYSLMPKAYTNGGMFGYGRFTDSLKKSGNSEDAYFLSEWNKQDTSCISSEITLNHSEDVWHKWLKTHKKGKYYLRKDYWMDTDGFIGSDGPTIYGMGGRFSDPVLLADKWYKIVLDKK